MKKPYELAQEIAAQIEKHGTEKFMGTSNYESHELWAEIAERGYYGLPNQSDGDS